ncbi:MmcQ/YjbR family DNA-binding protein [Glycomyces sp. NPDC021274]|uniref:MmcQ/YjbR family DNA-binding protein n=1 Tax=Glycomyces sp. NPDC021274 TaxID=3155120 RepID=UPI0033C1CD77
MDGKRLQAVAREVASSLPEVTEGRPFVDKLDVYKVAGKVFLIVTDDPAEQIITVKADPGDAEALKLQYASVTVGHYLDKRHWISVAAGDDITSGLVADLVATSYELAAQSLPRRDRPNARH